LLSVEAKLVQPASPCFQCNHLQVPEKLPEWLLFDFLTLTADKDKDNSKAIPFKLDHVIPSDELTHDTMAVGGATKCCNVQQCTCLDADF